MHVVASYITKREESLRVCLDKETSDETLIRVSFNPTDDDTVFNVSVLQEGPFPIYLDLWERVL